MDNVVDNRKFESYRDMKNNQKSDGKTLKNGSGGGGGDDMESRVQKLESDISDIKTNMNQVLLKLNEVNSLISKQPSEDKLNVMMVENNTKLLGDIRDSIEKLPNEDKLTLKIIENNSKVMESINASISKLPTEDKIDLKFAESKTELVKISSEIKIESANTEAKLQDVRLQIILWVLGLPALLFTLYKLYDLLPK